MNKSSTWTALRNPAFRKLWIATVISGTCVAAHDSAATWMMNVPTGSPFFISLISTVASLPFFLFTLPAGALADKLDRQKLIWDTSRPTVAELTEPDTAIPACNVISRHHGDSALLFSV
jgi:MFS family permease